MNPQHNQKFLKETFDILFQNSLDIILLIDKEGIILDANIQTCRYFGLTLPEIKETKLSDYVKEKKELEEFLETTSLSGNELTHLTFLTKDDEELTFHLSSTLIKSDDSSFIILLCRDIQDMIDSTLQRKFFFDLFQHDLLNNLHAEIGYLDFLQRLYDSDILEKTTGKEMMNKLRELIVRNIYLIQNANISLVLQNERDYSNQKLDDIVNHALSYINNFFSKRIKAVLNRTDDITVFGDEYLYRVFTNLIIRMVEYTDDKVDVEVTISPPHYESAKIILHFEGVTLSSDEKSDILETESYDRSKLDLAVIGILLSKYNISLKIEDVKRMGEIVGTRMVLALPVV